MKSTSLNSEQAAALIGVKPGTLAAWRYRKQGPRFIKVSQNVVRYMPEDVQAFLDARTVEPAVPVAQSSPLPSWLTRNKPLVSGAL
ncbi:MAG: DNA-binding protein [Candidatus Accumulibacter phosphatis]|jgi:hypothetical protein|uniref:helix-turn-helix transcriptional regulator n=1 Tax=Candidatus Accumulibacter phosphatis TaxID=327160 RepID=UPI001A487DC2|nr:DNA-binding protein [Candidatus Accumulibacter phosphatis]